MWKKAQKETEKARNKIQKEREIKERARKRQAQLKCSRRSA